MAEYTWDDIIIDPTSERAKEAIGRLVYYADVPLNCINYANVGLISFLGVLDETNQKCYPFYIKGNTQWACIIVKKEEPKTKYVPFESKEEFVRRYTEVKEGADFDTFEDNLFQCGMWLRYKENGDLILVTGLCDGAIYVRDFTFGVTWKEVLNKFEFLDGAPCGKESKDE